MMEKMGMEREHEKRQDERGLVSIGNCNIPLILISTVYLRRGLYFTDIHMLIQIIFGMFGGQEKRRCIMIQIIMIA